MRMNKRGDETGGAVLWIVLGIAVMIIIGLFVYNRINDVSTLFDAQNVKNKAAILSCQTGFQTSLTGSSDADIFAKYCKTFVPAEVGGKNAWVNCYYLENVVGAVVFTSQEVPSVVKERCSDIASKKIAYNKCLEFNNTRQSDNTNWKEYINGVECTKVFTPATFKIAETPDPSTLRFDVGFS